MEKILLWITYSKEVYWCVMCKCSVENVDNLLMHCLVAMELWDFAKSLVVQLAPPVFPTDTRPRFKSPLPHSNRRF